MAKYYLVVGNETHAQKLRDCRSDHIELAEVEAVEEWEKQHAQGSEDVIIRIIEAETKVSVFAVHKDNRDWLR